MMGIDGRIDAEAADVTASGGIRPEHVADLAFREVAVPVAGIADMVGIHEGAEGGVGGVAQGAPLIQPGEAAGCAGDALAIHTDGPKIEPALGIGPIRGAAVEHGHEDVAAVGLVVPGESPSVSAAAVERGIVQFGFGEIGGVASGAVEPEGTPDQFVLIPAPRVVEIGCVGDGVAVLAAMRVSEGVERCGVIEQLRGVGGLAGLENHGRGGEGGGGFGG